MRSGCKARAKINRRRIFDTLRINFFEATPQMPSDVQKCEVPYTTPTMKKETYYEKSKTTTT